MSALSYTCEKACITRLFKAQWRQKRDYPTGFYLSSKATFAYYGQSWQGITIPFLVSVPELVSALKLVKDNGLDYSHQYPTAFLAYRQYAITSRHNLSLESCRRCPKADDFHFWAYIPRYASKEKEAKENYNYVIQLNARSFHVIEKGKMTNLTGVCVMALTVLTSRLMTYSKLRLYLTYMHSLNYHW